MTKEKRNPDAKYQLLSEREKILIRPARYVGQIEPRIGEQWLVDGDRMKYRNTTWIPAFLKLFDEVIQNSCDHSMTPEGSHMTKVCVEWNPLTGQISVEDNGGIPIVIHREHKMYIPEMIFGHMHSGSNFDDNVKSTGAGQNGEGSTLVNIFSEEFIVESADGKKYFKQTFLDNMSNRDKPAISPSKRKFTKITWTVDEKYIAGLNCHENIAKVTRRVYDAAACNSHLKFYLNGELISFKKGFTDYVHMFKEDAICHSEENWDVGFAKSHTGEFTHISYVNGTASTQGGTHLDYIMDQVTAQIRTHVKKKTNQDIMPAQIKNHFMLFLNATIINPRYDSQTKENLVTNISDYGTKCTILDKTIRAIIKSDIMESILKWAEARALTEENKKVAAEQKKASSRDVEKHIEAAGDEPLKKVLHLTEGDSAIGSFVECRNVDFHGGYPLRGKVLNTRNLPPSKVMSNTECADMMSIVGVTIDGTVDVNALKYGTVVIMTDADPDGDCICGQLLNFWSRWPDMFHQGRIVRLCTPMYIVHVDSKREHDVWLYNRQEWHDYIKANGKPKRVDHIKGLGELEEEDYHRCVNEPKYQIFRLDKKSEDALELAFGKSADPRKPWLLGA